MRTPISLLLLTGLGLIPVSWADLTPKSHIGIAGIDFQSQLAIDRGYMGNVTYLPAVAPARNAAFWGVRPQLQALAERGQDRYQLHYRGDYRRYRQAGADDYRDHDLGLLARWRYGAMQGLTLTLQDTLGHELRGRGISEGFLPQQFIRYGITTPLRTTLQDGQLRYSYGADEGRGKAEMMLSYRRLRYGNTRQAQQADDAFYNYIREQEWHENGQTLELFDQYSPQTRFRYSLVTHQRYYRSNGQKNSNEYSLLYGVKSQLTGNSAIDANVSWLYKTFNADPARPFSGLNWDVSARWQPHPQRSVVLHSAQRIKDPSQVGGYILVSEYGLSYTQDLWRNRLSSTLDYRYRTEDYKKQADSRRDRNAILSLALNYDFRPSICFQLKYMRDTLRSSKRSDLFYIGPDEDQPVERTLGYDNDLIMFTAKVQI
ncbi:outer membrane beta-barrel protein [Edwardsiella piscicida]|uniref:outer membrane beta-barrel protein n=1 Tax=Edwardsiella piscicida TaxID=1263550 RepID=UPI00291586C1|nr:outer membrane beta-barrel protein [Edwardsiella piscicida]